MITVIWNGKAYQRKLQRLARFPQIKTVTINGTVFAVKRERDSKGDETGRYVVEQGSKS